MGLFEMSVCHNVLIRLASITILKIVTLRNVTATVYPENFNYNRQHGKAYKDFDIGHNCQFESGVTVT